MSNLHKVLKAGIPLRHGIEHDDIIKSYIGTLCLGQSDFEAIENFRKDDYFKRALSIDHLPSSSRLRQRLDEQADTLLPIIQACMIDFLVNAKVPVTALAINYVALDIAVPLRHPAKRRRIKTVIQELMYLAARKLGVGFLFL